VPGGGGAASKLAVGGSSVRHSESVQGHGNTKATGSAQQARKRSVRAYQVVLLGCDVPATPSSGGKRHRNGERGSKRVGRGFQWNWNKMGFLSTFSR